jgi:hypothetical protein
MRFINQVATNESPLRSPITRSCTERFSLDHTCKRRKETGAHAIHGTGLRVFLMLHISVFLHRPSNRATFLRDFLVPYSPNYTPRMQHPQQCNLLPVSSSLVPIRL